MFEVPAGAQMKCARCGAAAAELHAAPEVMPASREAAMNNADALCVTTPLEHIAWSTLLIMADDFDPTDGCFVIAAPREDAPRIEAEMSGHEPPPGAIFVREVLVEDFAMLQCLLAGTDPNAPWEPRRTRYNPFTRSQQIQPRWEVVNETWQCVVGGVWRTMADVGKLAAAGDLQTYSALVLLVPDDLSRALTEQRSPDLAQRWRSAMPEGGEPDVEAALDALVAAVRRASETGHSVFVIQVQ